MLLAETSVDEVCDGSIEKTEKNVGVLLEVVPIKTALLLTDKSEEFVFVGGIQGSCREVLGNVPGEAN